MTTFISLDSILPLSPFISISSVFLLSPILSLVATTKDYYEIIHKLMELHPNYSATDYSELGTLITYAVLTFKRFCIQILTFDWLQNIWSLPIIVPDIASAMISEVSVLDGYLHNAFTFLETPLAYGKTNYSFYGLEKFFVGFINSFFLFLPTSAAHIIFFRRLVFQGIAGGYVAGVGIIAGNILWFASILFGWRFFVIPWLSLDILRYFLGFIILIQFMYHTSRDKRILGNLSKSKIFLINFLLAFTEQTNIYPFVTNMSVGAESSILETFPVDNLGQFIFIHTAYLLGLLVGSFTLLNFTCWLWENPVAKIYNWLQNNVYMPNLQKNLNLFFLYVLMVCTISSFPYYGLDYTVTNPLGFVADDRFLMSHKVIEGKKKATFPELAFLTSKAWEADERQDTSGDRVVRRWKSLLRVYKGMDTSLYNKGVYNNLLTIEDLNYGFDKAWLRRRRQASMRRFQLNEPFKSVFVNIKKKKNEIAVLNKDSARAPGFNLAQEFFHSPNFHESSPLLPTFKGSKQTSVLQNEKQTYSYDLKESGKKEIVQKKFKTLLVLPVLPTDRKDEKEFNIPYTDSVLRKVIRKINTRIKSSEIRLDQINFKRFNNPIYSKRWKQILSPDYLDYIRARGVEYKEDTTLQIHSLKMKMPNNDLNQSWQKPFLFAERTTPFLDKHTFSHLSENQTLKMLKERLSKKDRQILRYKTKLALRRTNPFGKGTGGRPVLPVDKPVLRNLKGLDINNANTMLHPIKFYLQKDKAFSRKLKFYGASVFRKLSIENNAPHFRTIMKRVFPFYKPTRRYINTMKSARLLMGRSFRKKKSRHHKKIKERDDPSTNSFSKSTSNSFRRLQTRRASLPQSEFESDLRKLNSTLIQTPSTFSIGGKKASRLRNVIFKQALFSWYYIPFNRALSKLDIDSFIRRQPNSHFLTKKDEQGLHLKRFLLSDHYETLRWYTYMQHYRAMKTKIGGTKSFASKFVYNQQFQGTLKKVRHLFAITPSLFSYADKELPSSNNSPFDYFLNKKEKPSLKNKNVLKFDQPLYNEYSNSKTKSILNDSVTHEELLSPYKTKTRVIKASLDSNSDSESDPFSSNQSVPSGYLERKKDDFITFSTSIVREYLKTAKPIRKATIKQLIFKKNYKELSQFLLSGQKIRGIRPITNQSLLLRQEMNYMMPLFNSEVIKKSRNTLPQILSQFSHKIKQEQLRFHFKDLAYSLNIENTAYFTLLTEYKNGLYNKEFSRSESGKNLLQLKSKNGAEIIESNLFNAMNDKNKFFKDRLTRLKKWLAPNPSQTSIFSTNGTYDNKEQEVLQQAPFDSDYDSDNKEDSAFFTDKKSLWTTGLKKALKESVPASSNSDSDVREGSRFDSPASFLLNTKGVQKEGPKGTVSSIYKKLTEKEERQSISRAKKILNLSQRFVGAGFVRTQGVSTLFKDKIKEIINLILNKPTSFLKLKAITKKKIKSWSKKDQMLTNSSRTRKKYLKYSESFKNELEGQEQGQNAPFSPGEIKSIGDRSGRKIRNQLLEQTFRSRTKKGRAQNARRAADKNPFATENNPSSPDFESEGKGTQKYSIARNPSSPKGKGKEEGFTKNYNFRKNKKNYSSTKTDDRQKGIKDILESQNLPQEKQPSNLTITDEYKVSAAYFKALFSPSKTLRSRYYVYRPNRQQDSRFKNPRKESFYRALTTNPFKDQPTNKEFVLNEGFNSYKINSNQRAKFDLLQNRIDKTQQKKWADSGAYIERNQFLHLNDLTKQIKQAQSNFKLQKWWWESFGPYNYQATVEVDWQLAKDRYFDNLISRLSKNAILERDFLYSLKNALSPSYSKGLASSSYGGEQAEGKYSDHIKQAEFLQIGNYDFKPLAIPQAFRIRDILNQLQKKNQSQSSSITSSIVFPSPNKAKKSKLLTFFKKQNSEPFLLTSQTRIRKIFMSEKTPNLIKKLYGKIFQSTPQSPLEIPLENTSNLINKLYGNIFNFTPESSIGISTTDSFKSKAKELSSVNLKISPKSFLKPTDSSITGAFPEWTASPKGKGPTFSPTYPGGRKRVKTAKLASKKQLSFLMKRRISTTPIYKPVEFTEFKSESKFFVNSNPLPFYAGWDESLRKFVVTNRLLSRRDAGYSATLPPSSLIYQTQTTPPSPLPSFTPSYGQEEGTGKSMEDGQAVGAEGEKIEFSNAPLQGLNKGTTLYYELPFATFSTEQSLDKGMDAFAPIGWRRLEFTHSIFKTKALNTWLHRTDSLATSVSLPLVKGSRKKGMEKSKEEESASPQGFFKGELYKEDTNRPSLKPLLIKNIFTKSEAKTKTLLNNNLNFIYKLQKKAQLNYSSVFKQPLYSYNAIKNSNNYLRGFLRLTREKDQSRPSNPANKNNPEYLIAGPLIHEVLPMHYVIVFAQTGNRALKDRYLNRRKPRLTSEGNIPPTIIPSTITEFSTFATTKSNYENNYDFTFRRRVKTRRKLHRKSLAIKTNTVNLRRRRFTVEVSKNKLFNKSEDQSLNLKGTNYSNFRKELTRQRPLNQNEIIKRGKKIKKEPAKLRKEKEARRKRARAQQEKEARKKRDTEKERGSGRILRQVINTEERSNYSPQAGGFVWPGDYLRLETTQTPKLVLQNESVTESVTEILRNFKNKRSFSQVYPQPRDYLLESHNVKVLKKKLEKAQRSNLIKQRIKQLKLVYK